jgi:hypothetical protein
MAELYHGDEKIIFSSVRVLLFHLIDQLYVVPWLWIIRAGKVSPADTIPPFSSKAFVEPVRERET